MVEYIIKRDGREVPFELTKIEKAIEKALEASHERNDKLAMSLAIKTDEKLEELGLEKPSVEDIQDVVEQVLIENDLLEVAKRYIVYRQERTNIRESNTKLMNVYKSITFNETKENDIKRENANIDGDTPMGMMLKFGSEATKEFAKKFLMKKEFAYAHDNGDIHIHDMDFYYMTTTCCQIDLTKLFHNGFSTGHGFLREPNSIASYAALACIAIQSNQNDQHGGQSIPMFDYDMAPGVKKTYIKSFRANLEKALELEIPNFDLKLLDSLFEASTPSMSDNSVFEDILRNLLIDVNKNTVDKIITFVKNEAYKDTDKQTYQAMESLIHNLNTMHSRAGAQVPFSSLNYGTDTSVEGRMVMRNLLMATDKGLGNGETPIFPIQIFKIKDGVNYYPNDPNYDLFMLACKVSAKRLFPNFSFIDASFNKIYYKPGDPRTEIAYMGCRTRVAANVDKDNEIVTGRGNLSFTSINLPRLGILAKGDISKFFDMLDEKLNLVIAQLYERYLIQIHKHVYNFPFLMGQGVWLGSEKLKWDDTLESVLKQGTLTVGFIGLAETLVALTGHHHGETKEAQELGLKIVKYMRDRCDEETKKTGLNYSLIATPAEGLSGRFVKIDKKKFGIIPGVTNHEYYTNSFHIPVYYKISAFKKIEIEGQYHELTNGGHITYVELDGDMTKNLDAFVAVVKHMHDSNIGYGSVNHPVDRDPVCGFTGIINDRCPLCGRSEGGIPFERIRRITGYLVGTLDRFNNAKLAEVKERVKHGITTD